ncbi:Protein DETOXIFICATION 42 [Ranunculus cassubicifolius]
MAFRIFFNDARFVFNKDELGLEIARIALPAAIAITADPIASLIDTAFIGHIGPVELAAVGVSIALFNQISRITIFPLVSVTTSFVAEEDAANRVNDANESYNLEKALPKSKEMKILMREHGETEQLLTNSGEETILNIDPKRRISSASSALVIGGYLGVFQAILLIFAGKYLLSFMGIKDGSPMLTPALQYLTLRSLGSPAILLSLAMQGIFRGFKDTKTPLYATVAGDVTNIMLDPIFIFVFHWGVKGAAFAHIISQYLIAVILLLRLRKRIDLLPPSISELQLGRFLKNGSLLLARVIAVTFCVTLSASMAARLGPIPMAAFQISLQIWLATSLLADGLAVAGQAILASAFAEKDHEKAKSTAARVLQHGLILGLLLSFILGVGLQFGSRLFTEDTRVLHLVSISIPFVAATQPINSLAFVFDGINFGASDFAYSALSMFVVAIVSILFLFILFNSLGFIGIWIALTIYMSLRMFAGFLRVGTGSGPWRFLRS